MNELCVGTQYKTSNTQSIALFATLPYEILGDCTSAVQVPGDSSRGLPTATSPNFCGCGKGQGVRGKQISILLRTSAEYINNNLDQSESVAN